MLSSLMVQKLKLLLTKCTLFGKNQLQRIYKKLLIKLSDLVAECEEFRAGIWLIYKNKVKK